MRILLASLSLVLILVASVMTATTAAFAQLMSESDIREQLMNALIETSENTAQTQTTNATRSELAQAITQVVDADPSCNILFNTCVNIIYESPSKVVLTAAFIHTRSQTHNVIIWEIVEMLETRGFSAESIDLTGQAVKAIHTTILL